MDWFLCMQCNKVVKIHKMNGWVGCLINCFLSPQGGIDSEVEHNNAKHILLEMGEFFQIQVQTYISCISTNHFECIRN